MYEELVNCAKTAMKSAYAPYSHYFVGAAIMGKSGRIYMGCNVENVAFSPTCCAERVALFKAVSEGEREFTALAICGGKNGEISAITPPCGVCRQALAEFCRTDMPVVLIDSSGYQAVTLADLTPYLFTAGGSLGAE